MSTSMKGTKTFHLTRFWGGKDRGQCIQLTERQPDSTRKDGLHFRYVSLSFDEAQEVIEALQQIVDGTREENWD